MDITFLSDQDRKGMPGRGTASARDGLAGPTLHRARVVPQRGASEASGAETHRSLDHYAVDSDSRPGHTGKVMGEDYTRFEKVALGTRAGNGLEGRERRQSLWGYRWERPDVGDGSREVVVWFLKKQTLSLGLSFCRSDPRKQ